MPTGDEGRQIQPAEITARLKRALDGQNEAEVGRSVNRVRSAVSAWKNGSAHPDLVTFANLCRERGWSADALLGLTPRSAPTADQAEEALAVLGGAYVRLRALLATPGAPALEDVGADEAAQRAALDAAVDEIRAMPSHETPASLAHAGNRVRRALDKRKGRRDRRGAK